MPELEIINGPLEVYSGPVGESFTAIGSAVSGNWVLVGTSGSLNYTEDGVSIMGEQSLEYFRSLGSPYPRKSFRTSADTIIQVTVADMTLANLALAFNSNSVTDDTGFDSLNMDQGLDVTEIALQIRGVGKSPALAASNLQFNIPRVVQEGNPELVFTKGDAVAYQLGFRAIYDESTSGGEVGLIVVDDTA